MSYFRYVNLFVDALGDREEKLVCHNLMIRAYLIYLEMLVQVRCNFLTFREIGRGMMKGYVEF